MQIPARHTELYFICVASAALSWEHFPPLKLVTVHKL